MPSGKLTLLTLVLTWPILAPAQQIAIGQYPVTDDGPGPITPGPDGALWFTSLNYVARITTKGVITEYPISTADSVPVGIVAGPDGALWFTEKQGNQIGRITTAGVIAEYPVPTAHSGPYAITVGRDGALWFTEVYANQIGRITTAGVITEYPVPKQYPIPSSTLLGAIATGPDGALWFSRGTSIVRITTPGSTTEYPIQTASGIAAISTGSDGALWFATDEINIGRITAAGAITALYPVPGWSGGLNALTAGADGALWFTGMPGKIGRITTAGAVTLYPIPPGTADGITTGPDGELWFTEFNSDGNNIGEVFFLTAGLTLSPATGVYQTNHTFTGSGFAPAETVRIYERAVGSTVLATVAADASGSFTVSAREPESPYGTMLCLAVGQSSHKLGAAGLTVTPRLVLSPDSGAAGSTVAVSGYGFPASARVVVYWSEPRILLGIATTDANGAFAGTFALTFTIPFGAAPGANRVQGVWDCTHESCPNSGYGSITVQ